jgi:hypothetical protein
LSKIVAIAFQKPANLLQIAVVLLADEGVSCPNGRVAVSRQAPPFSVIDRTTAKLPRRVCAEPLCSASSALTSTFAAGGWVLLALGLSKMRAIAIAIAAKLGRETASPPISAWTAFSTWPGAVGSGSDSSLRVR